MENDNSKNPQPQTPDTAPDTTPRPAGFHAWMLENERKVGVIALVALCAIIAIGVALKTAVSTETPDATVAPEDVLAKAEQFYASGEYEQAVSTYEEYASLLASLPEQQLIQPDWLQRAQAICYARQRGMAVTPDLAHAVANAKALYPFSSGLAVIEVDGNIKFINAAGEVITPREIPARPYDEREFRDGRLCVGIANAGYITTDGSPLEGFQAWRYDECYPFSDGLALVREKATGAYGYISTDGSLAIEPKYDAAHSFREGRAFVHRDDSWTVIDTDGKEYSSFASTYYDGATAETTGLTDGVAVVGDSLGMPIMINLRGEQMHLRTNDVNDHPAAFSEGLRAFRGDNGSYGYESLGARVVIEPIYRSAYNFHDGVAIVGDGKRYFGLTDKTGRLVVRFRYDRLHNSSDSLVVFGSKQSNGRMRYGVINHRGDTIHPCVYDSIAPFSSGFAAARKGYRLGYLDHYGLSTFDAE